MNLLFKSLFIQAILNLFCLLLLFIHSSQTTRLLSFASEFFLPFHFNFDPLQQLVFDPYFQPSTHLNPVPSKFFTIHLSQQPQTLRRKLTNLQYS